MRKAIDNLSQAANRTVVLFAHGIQGKPEQFLFLVNRLPEGVDSVNLLLPGHGGDVAQFRRSGLNAWLDCVCEALDKACDSYQRVIFVGHSMGCLLGLLAQERVRRKIDGMLLICCPFRLHFTWRYIKYSALSARARGDTADKFVKAAQEANGVKAKRAAEYLTCVRPYAALLRLIMKANRLTGSERPEISFFYSELDEIVSPRSVNMARRFSSRPAQVLPGCGHNYFTHEARERLVEEFKGML